MKIKKSWHKMSHEEYGRIVDLVVGDYTIYFDTKKDAVSPFIIVPNEDPTGRKHCYHFNTMYEAIEAAYERYMKRQLAESRKLVK